MTNLKADADAIKAIPPTPAAAEARATIATEAQRQAAIKAVSELPASGGGYMVLYHETLSDKIGEGSIAKIVDTALNAALALPPPEAKDGAAPSPEKPTHDPNYFGDGPGKQPRAAAPAPSPETGGPDLVPLDVFNEAERTHMAVVRETAAKASPETGWRLVPTRAFAAMLKAARNQIDAASEITDRELMQAWSAMLAAAPAAPSPDLPSNKAAVKALWNYWEDVYRATGRFDFAEAVAIVLKNSAPAAPSPDIVSLGKTALHRTAEGAERELREIVAAGRPAAPSPDLAALETAEKALKKFALNKESFPYLFEPSDPELRPAMYLKGQDYRDAHAALALVSAAILHLKAQPNAGPSADGGEGGR